MNTNRYLALDRLRGIALLNMIAYHSVWDIVYLFHMDWQWYHSIGAYIWQQCICWTFIFISGFCYSFGSKKGKRGVQVFLLGFLVSVCTWIVMPDNCVSFGILTLIGSCMLLMIPMERLLEKINPIKGTVFSLMLFVLTRNVNQGYLGFETWNIIKLPDSWYRNLITTYFGFPKSGFSSTDYFSLFPWIFLFITGYFLNNLFRKYALLKYLEPHRSSMLEWLGQHSLQIYIFHQPIIYCVFMLLFLYN